MIHESFKDTPHGSNNEEVPVEREGGGKGEFDGATFMFDRSEYDLPPMEIETPLSQSELEALREAIREQSRVREMCGGASGGSGDVREYFTKFVIPQGASLSRKQVSKEDLLLKLSATLVFLRQQTDDKMINVMGLSDEQRREVGAGFERIRELLEEFFDEVEGEN